MGTARPAPADRARAVPRAGGRRHASPSSASPARSSSATPRRTATSRSGSGPTGLDGAYAFRSLLGLGRGRRERLGRADRGARPARRDPRRRAAHDRRSARRGIPGSALTVEQALLAIDREPRLALGRRAMPRQAPPRLPRRSRRALPRSARVPARRARDASRSSRRWSAAAGCTTRRPGADVRESIDRSEGGVSSAPIPRRTTGHDPAIAERVYESSSSAAGSVPARSCWRSGRARARRRGGCSSSAPRGSSRSSRIPALAALPPDGHGRPTEILRGDARGGGAAATRRSISPPLRRRSTGWTRSRPRGRRAARSARAAGGRCGGRTSGTDSRPDPFVTRSIHCSRPRPSPRRRDRRHARIALDPEAALGRARRGRDSSAPSTSASAGAASGTPTVSARSIGSFSPIARLEPDRTGRNPRRDGAHRRARVRRAGVERTVTRRSTRRRARLARRPYNQRSWPARTMLPVHEAPTARLRRRPRSWARSGPC